jgi:hypothetical protein
MQSSALRPGWLLVVAAALGPGCASERPISRTTHEIEGVWQLTACSRVAGDGDPGVIAATLVIASPERLTLLPDGRFEEQFSDLPGVPGGNALIRGRWHEWSDLTLRRDIESTQPADLMDRQDPQGYRATIVHERQGYILDGDSLYLITPDDFFAHVLKYMRVARGK